MLQTIPASTPEAQTETARLRADIRRMADMVSGVVRNTALDATDAALAIAAAGKPTEARKVARQLLERAEVMHGEIERFFAANAQSAIRNPGDPI